MRNRQGCQRGRYRGRRTGNTAGPATRPTSRWRSTSFYVNALYVGMTRGRSRPGAGGIRHWPSAVGAARPEGSRRRRDRCGARPRRNRNGRWKRASWNCRASKEQASAIRETFLKSRPTPWSAWSEAAIRALEPRALLKTDPSAKHSAGPAGIYGLWARPAKIPREDLRHLGARRVPRRWRR